MLATVQLVLAALRMDLCVLWLCKKVKRKKTRGFNFEGEAPNRTIPVEIF